LVTLCSTHLSGNGRNARATRPDGLPRQRRGAGKLWLRRALDHRAPRYAASEV
jgi:hypothetical protein